MILEQKVKINWNNKHKYYYESKGYKFTKRGGEFEVDVKDLLPFSKVKVDVKCDYCGKIYNVQNVYALKAKNNIHACNDCIKIKRKEIFLEEYGVENLMQLDSVKEKARQTNLKRYGGPAPINCEKVKNKMYQTNLKRYGVKIPSSSKIVKEKIKKTTLERFGVDCVFKNEEIKRKIAIKTAKTMYKNNTGPSSTQQRYLCDLLNGELNYPVDNCLLDIAFPKEKIYIEYDGSGHRLRIKFGMSKQQFEREEINRQYYIKNKGWKLIRIVSSKDKLLDDTDTIKIINYCKNYLLNTNRSWVKINIDNNQIESSEFCYELSNLLCN